ncbi:TonB-dependent receptor [Fulvivirga sp. RKSG066]|uniref:TonB-dependent receptor n=1 Tax=Fulvivirga aurantia TaxID=2529383 RepID=UPI0012BC7DB2|nr:TonB-dependent receptor [Fulvivirga aurantia]MTI21150.1 TonB-dependent receptor [Fulvivirga aurantia]
MSKILQSGFWLAIFFCLSTSLATAQERTVSGVVKEADSGEPLVGANVIIEGTTTGTVTDLNGNFKLSVPSGNATLVVSFIGYQEQSISVAAGESDLGDISLETAAIGLDEIEVIASVAIDRKTPVAVSTIKQAEIIATASNQEFPELLKSTPGVYATKQGGGYGDSRINLRGFNSENVAVLINGVPVNDMENGRVYWSNWAGLTDVTRSMQVQRGLGASKVAVPSIGGTINILTKTTDINKGGTVFASTGNNNFSKVGFSVSTGLLENDWAVTMSAAKIQGDGYVEGTQFEGYNYFLNVSKMLNDSHTISFTGFGAPQQHGQRQNRLPIQTIRNAPQDIRYNPDWGILEGKEKSIEDNFYHKPQMSLNHYWTISKKSELSTALYASVGTGGGGRSIGFSTNPITGDAPRTGDIYSPVDLDALVDENQNSADGSALYALGASRNDHRWYGALSTYSTELTDEINLLGGLDLRYYKGIHFREVTNLLGADYYVDDSDVNNPNNVVEEGGKYSYYNDGIVLWEGGFLQGEYTSGDLSAFVSLAASNTSYKRVDYFNYLDSDPLQETDFVNFFGYQVKGGANYNLTKNHNIFGNIGYFEKAPNFDAVFQNFENDINEDAENQKILSFEAGYGYRTRTFNANVNLYRTNWKDRTLIVSAGQGEDEVFANVTGVNALHQGIEFDFEWRPVDALTVRGMGSFGDWVWQNNITDVSLLDANQNVTGTVNVFIADLKVGDAAQTTGALGVRYEVFDNLRIGADFNYYANNYADFDPNSRDNEDDKGVQSWQLPDYGVLNANLRYKFKIGELDASLLGNLNNALNTEFISDARDGGAHNAQDAEVYYGQGRTWTLGLRVNF